MLSKKVIIKNTEGLHMRPAMTFAQNMSKFSSNIDIKYNGSSYNAKSVMNIMAGAMKCGAEVEIVCSGADEKEALDKAAKLLEGGLDD